MPILWSLDTKGIVDEANHEMNCSSDKNTDKEDRYWS